MAEIRINRKLGTGPKPLTKVFPGLGDDPHFQFLFGDGLRDEVLAKTLVNVVAEDAYCYIDDKRGWVNLGLEYLRTGDERTLYLDILHELTHIRQWHEGKELWDRRYAYVDRPTEVEAYEVAVKVARQLGMTDGEIADYLRVEWISHEDYVRLCLRLGVRIPESHAY
jgi:hypothetical protein